MIQPLTSESDWLPVFAASPHLPLPSQALLILAPHPDDETLATGGLIALARAQNLQVTVAAATDGENAYAGVSGLGPIRVREQTAALAELGLDQANIVRLQLPDSGLQSCLPELIARLRPHVTPHTHLFAPWPGDFHPDHQACGEAALQLATETGAPLTWWFFWTWHRGTPATIAPLPLRLLPLSPGVLQQKQRALQCHHSQLHAPAPALDPILPTNLLAPALRPFEVYATHG